MLSINDINMNCLNCEGTGKEFPDCEVCNGKGWVVDEKFGGTMTCPYCENEGCSWCVSRLSE